MSILKKRIVKKQEDGSLKQVVIPLTDEQTKERKKVEEETAQEEIENGYKRARKSDYPDVGEQLDALMKWVFTETEISLPDELKSLAAKCMSVKSKHPKPKDS